MSASLLQAACSEKILNIEPDMSDLNFTESKMKNSGSGPANTVSPIPVVFRYSSARLAMARGSRS
ncbi:hypothetical protein D3C81_1638310 [compost metagenome]